MNAELKKLEDKVWKFKEVCEDLETRKLTAGDGATLNSVERDLDRLIARVTGVRDKFKRGARPKPGESDAQQPLLGEGGSES